MVGGAELNGRTPIDTEREEEHNQLWNTQCIKQKHQLPTFCWCIYNHALLQKRWTGTQEELLAQGVSGGALPPAPRFILNLRAIGGRPLLHSTTPRTGFQVEVLSWATLA